MTRRSGRATLGTGVALLLVVVGAGLVAGAGLLASAGAGAGSGWPAQWARASSTGATSGVFVANAAPGATSTTDASVSGRIAMSAVAISLELVPRKPRSKAAPEVRAVVTNLSASKVATVIVDIESAPGGLALKPAGKQQIRGIGAGRSASVTWSLCAPVAGTYELRAVTTSNGARVLSPPVRVTLPASRC